MRSISISVEKGIEKIKNVEESLPDTFEEFSRLGLVKDGIYKR